MPQPSCMCTVLLKLAKVERLKSQKFWVHVLIITVIISTWTLYNRCSTVKSVPTRHEICKGTYS